MGFPACFNTQKQYDEWKSLARLSRELVTICTDCTKDYRDQMLEQRRCIADKWSKIAFHSRQERTLEAALSFIDVRIVKRTKNAGTTTKNKAR